MLSKSPELNALITRFGESYSSVSMSRESTRLKKIKQQLVEFCQCTNIYRSEKNAIFVFPVSAFCQVMQKHKLFGVAQ